MHGVTMLQGGHRTIGPMRFPHPGWSRILRARESPRNQEGRHSVRSAPARFVSIVLLAFVAAASGCSDSNETPSVEAVPSADPEASFGQSSATSSSAPATQGTLTASPNPIQVCDGTGLGVTHLSWSVPTGGTVEVRVGKPDGTLFAQTGNIGEKDTGKWVGEGTVFYLVRAAVAGRPAAVLGTTKVHVTREGCK
mgnify:CR=1 FL=1